MENDILRKSKELLERLGIRENENDDLEIERQSEEGQYIPFDFETFCEKIAKFK